MQIGIEIIVAVGFLIIGLSHIFQAKAWSEFFIRFRDKGPVGSLQLGLLHLPMALLIVSFHNVWHGLPTLVTIIGWGQLLKSTLYLVWPQHGLRMLGTISIERSWRFIAGGLFSIAVSAVIFLSLWQTGARIR